LQQILQYFSLALREVELLGDLGQRDQSGGTSFKQDGYAGVSRIFCLRIHDERTAKITPPAGSELGHKGRSTWGLSVRQARANLSCEEGIRAL